MRRLRLGLGTEAESCCQRHVRRAAVAHPTHTHTHLPARPPPPAGRPLFRALLPVHTQFVASGPEWLATLLEVVPSFALFRGLWEMSQYAFLGAANGTQGACGAAAAAVGCLVLLLALQTTHGEGIRQGIRRSEPRAKRGMPCAERGTHSMGTSGLTPAPLPHPRPLPAPCACPCHHRHRHVLRARPDVGAAAGPGQRHAGGVGAPGRRGRVGCPQHLVLQPGEAGDGAARTPQETPPPLAAGTRPPILTTLWCLVFGALTSRAYNTLNPLRPKPRTLLKALNPPRAPGVWARRDGHAPAPLLPAWLPAGPRRPAGLGVVRPAGGAPALGQVTGCVGACFFLCVCVSCNVQMGWVGARAGGGEEREGSRAAQRAQTHLALAGPCAIMMMMMRAGPRQRQRSDGARGGRSGSSGARGAVPQPLMAAAPPLWSRPRPTVQP